MVPLAQVRDALFLLLTLPRRGEEHEGMKLLISTPCAGGLATTGWVESILVATAHLRDEGHEVVVKMQGKESLINRARNTDATFALTEGFDKCFFIDSDIVFSWAQMRSVLLSKEKIVGGTYPLKNFPVTLNFNPLLEQRDLFGKSRSLTDYAAWTHKYADRDSGEAEVMHLPTGFLCVSTEVFAKLSYVVPWYRSYMSDTKTVMTSYEFFPTSVVDHQLESEDWGFCRLAREAGFRIVLQTRAVTRHIGSWTFTHGQHGVIERPIP